jgi:protoporphyrin/coproporphyrin ferrochelatase
MNDASINAEKTGYDAILLVSFGGPEGPDDVMPFLENVVRDKNVPPERLKEVAGRYTLFDGVSPLNAQNRVLLGALVAELNAHGPKLPVYWGNRNWHPMLADAVQQMADDGVQKALALVTSAFGSYSGCRQYLEDIEQARREVGPEAPRIDKLRLFYNHPGFIEPMAERVAAALERIPPERRGRAKLIFTAHSLPAEMAERSPYERQLREACRLVVESGEWRVERGTVPIFADTAKPSSAKMGLSPLPQAQEWQLVFQSRSGPPAQKWLGPDIRDYLRQLYAAGEVKDVVVVPIGFLAENLEVVYDLDVEAAELCEELGINMVRADVVGSHPRFVSMIRELILERIDPATPRLALGLDGPWPDQCPGECCKPN